MQEVAMSNYRSFIFTAEALGDELYAAPERFRNEYYDTKVDVFFFCFFSPRVVLIESCTYEGRHQQGPRIMDDSL
ncbi:hypothetical protein vseg_001822 [Gypsophila vaccaria]